MWAFDNLPRAVRFAAARGALTPNAEILRNQLVELTYRFPMAPAGALGQIMAAAMPEKELEAIETFATDYERRHKLPLPHVAAQATVLR